MPLEWFQLIWKQYFEMQRNWWSILTCISIWRANLQRSNGLGRKKQEWCCERSTFRLVIALIVWLHNIFLSLFIFYKWQQCVKCQLDQHWIWKLLMWNSLLLFGLSWWWQLTFYCCARQRTNYIINILVSSL